MSALISRSLAPRPVELTLSSCPDNVPTGTRGLGYWIQRFPVNLPLDSSILDASARTDNILTSMRALGVDRRAPVTVTA